MGNEEAGGKHQRGEAGGNKGGRPEMGDEEAGGKHQRGEAGGNKGRRPEVGHG